MDPEEIENRQFLVQLRGYARDEVEVFREEVAQEIKILRKQLTKATSDLSHANTELANAKAQLAEASAQLEEERNRSAPAVEPNHVTEPAADERVLMYRQVGQETERILLAAEEAAEQIQEQAAKEAAQLMADTRMRVERSLAELEAARRAAEEDFAGIRDSRSMVASQLEDIRRRLEETISRLRVPVELPGAKPASRFRPQQELAERVGHQTDRSDRRQPDPQALRQRELEAARELLARQMAHRGEADRREEELKAVQADAELRARARADAERRARERAAAVAAEAAARKKAQQAANLQAAVAGAQEADRVKVAGEAESVKAVRDAESVKAAEEAAAAAKARADEQSAARHKAERAEAERVAAKKAAKAQAEQARAEAQRAAEAEKERLRQEQAAEAERSGVQKRKSAPAAEPKPAAAAPARAGGQGGSSLDELLAEIRRKREEEERHAAQPQEVPAPPAAKADHSVELARRSEALGDLPAQTARRLKRLLQEEHNDLLDRLRTQRGKGELEDNVPPEKEQLDRFLSGLGEGLSRAFAEGRKAAGAAGDSDPTAGVTKLVTRQVLNPLRSEISKAIQVGLEAQESAATLSERANDVFRVWKGIRTQLLGEGIAYAAYHQGLLNAWSSRDGVKKSWVFSAEEQDCPNDICRRNAEAGGVALKTPFPSGHLAPPAHGGCTCTLAGT